MAAGAGDAPPAPLGRLRGSMRLSRDLRLVSPPSQLIPAIAVFEAGDWRTEPDGCRMPPWQNAARQAVASGQPSVPVRKTEVGHPGADESQRGAPRFPLFCCFREITMQWPAGHA